MNTILEQEVLTFVIRDPLELNLSYMPFIIGGGLFIPTLNHYALGDPVVLDLQFPIKNENIRVEGKVVWITPQNALHHVLPGIGIQFTGSNSQTLRNQIEAHLDTTMDIGGYTYGITEEIKGSS